MSLPSPSTDCVAAVIATHRRDRELGRLLASLARSRPSLTGGVVVADNAASPETEKMCAASPLPCVWLPRSANDGPGPAWNTGIRHALANPGVSHILVLDDDVDLPSDALGVLLETMTESRTAAVAPLLCDDLGRLWAFPEPQETPLRPAIRAIDKVAQAPLVLGAEPHPFCWATGACMLYSRAAFAQAGFFREDFWMLGEDLEFSMRVAATLGGVFTARVAVPHLPPPPTDPVAHRIGHRLKFLALLQNLSYLAFHSPHRAHLRNYLAGNFKRYLRTEGAHPGTLRDACTAFFQGAIHGRPAGTAAGYALRERARRRMEHDSPE